MKKSELIALLNEIEGDPEVWVSSDEEGNSFDTVGAVQEEQMYGEGREAHPVADEDIGVEYDEEDLVRVIVIWP